MSAEERRALHETWVLLKAFQDLTRGVRASLEGAYFVSEMVAAGHIRVKTETTLEDLLRPFQKKANEMNFPDLLAAVNERLEKPLAFSEAYLSMQAARNCLEHRQGVVGNADAKTDGKMVLQFPRLKWFILRNGEEVELEPNMAVEEDGRIFMKIDLRHREYIVGQRFSLTAADFDEICFACSQFATDLGAGLAAKATVVPRHSPQ
jgi:hypothetical protein